MAKGAYQQELALEVIDEWIYSTEKIIGAIMKKRKVLFTDNSRQNIRIKLKEQAKGMVDLSVYYRDTLRFTDMGAAIKKA
jgi:hypothetical protein